LKVKKASECSGDVIHDTPYRWLAVPKAAAAARRRGAAAAAVASTKVPRQRRIRDSDDDDDDDIPVSRKAIAALLPLPQSKMPQLVAPNDDLDDEIVLLRTTQSTQQGATIPSVASSAAPIDIPTVSSRSALNTVQLDDNRAYEQGEDDDAPMVHPSEMNHNVDEREPSASRPSAAASSGVAAAARPKLKGLGSLVRRWAHVLQSCFSFALHHHIRPLVYEQTHALVQ
jgi:hypothetical protein